MFERIGHETTYAPSVNKHFFTISCHHLTKIIKRANKIGHIFRKMVHIKKNPQWSPKGELTSEAFFWLHISQKEKEIL